MWEWVQALLELVHSLGYLGIFLGMTLESSFFPFPSEAVLIPAGALAAQGKMTIFTAFLMGTLGSLVGALINYYLALFLGRYTVDRLVEKYGKFLFLNKKKLKKSDKYFDKHGEITTFVGRLIPVVRQVISLSAGFSKMNIWRFVIYTALGAGIWSMVLVLVGFYFGTSFSWFAVIIFLIIFVLLIVFGYRFLNRYEIKEKKQRKAERKNH